MFCLGAQKGHAERGDAQHDAFVVVGSLQNKKGFGAGPVLTAAPMWGYVPFPIAVHWGPSDIGYPRCSRPCVHTGKSCKKASLALAGALSEMPAKEETTATDAQEVVCLL